MEQEVLAAYAKNMVAASTSYFGYTLGEWVSILSIVFIVVNTISVLPATIKVVRDFFNRFRKD